ncbi:MAG: glycosyltransferase family 4 protein [Gammaproteobacteria bacterium]|nr:glycosyltransferase family 4 protein [Gammaproteobacteria bacterium]
MKIILIEDYFSEKMGYSENCLPKVLSDLGHEVHVVTSNLQVYGNLPNYNETYGCFLGPAVQPCGVKEMGGYWLHRLPHKLWFGYVNICGLIKKIRELDPDVVHVFNCVSINALKLALFCNVSRYKLFTGCHQSLCVTKPYLSKEGISFKKMVYFVTRTIPGWVVSLFTKRCFAITPDCAEVANRYYGIKKSKIKTISLGADTELFTPLDDDSSQRERLEIRKILGIGDSDIVCIYTGRFSLEKDPLILARAIFLLRQNGLPYSAIFIGDGVQKREIQNYQGCITIPFVPYSDLPKYYRAADIAVWPKQVTISMFDAASCGIPLVVSDLMGEPDRAEGNGEFYRDNDVDDLARVLGGLNSADIRCKLGKVGRLKMLEKYSWLHIAKEILKEYDSSMIKSGRL